MFEDERHFLRRIPWIGGGDGGGGDGGGGDGGGDGGGGDGGGDGITFETAVPQSASRTTKRISIGFVACTAICDLASIAFVRDRRAENGAATSFRDFGRRRPRV